MGIKADFENAKWVLLALYNVAVCVFFALQLATVFGVMLIFARVWLSFMWVPFFAAIVHYALPFYLANHFKYLRYLVQ